MSYILFFPATAGPSVGAAGRLAGHRRQAPPPGRRTAPPDPSPEPPAGARRTPLRPSRPRLDYGVRVPAPAALAQLLIEGYGRRPSPAPDPPARHLIEGYSRRCGGHEKAAVGAAAGS